MRRLTTVLILIAACGCGGTPTDPGRAPSVELASTPASMTATICPASSCGAGSDEVEAIATLTLRETAGGHATLDGFTVVIRRNIDTATVLDVTVGIGAGTRVAAFQTVSAPLAVHFPRAQASSAMTMTVTANMRDDRTGAAVRPVLHIPLAPVGG